MEFGAIKNINTEFVKNVFYYILVSLYSSHNLFIAEVFFVVVIKSV